MKKPKLTRQVVEGIIAATEVVLAGDQTAEGGECESDAEDIAAANMWAHEMRNHISIKGE
jgi:hypothetical protein